MGSMRNLTTLVLAALLCTACNSTPHLSSVDVIGTYAFSDQDNELFNVLVHPGGKCVSTWWKGESGAAGEVGSWEVRGDKLRLRWTDGWLNVVGHSRLGLIRQSWSPGRAENAAPLDAAPVRRAEGPRVPFLGVWLSCASSAGNALHFAVRGDGMVARSCGATMTVGTWEVDADGATLVFADGVVHRLLRDGDTWREEVFAPGAAPESKPTHSGTPTRY